MSTHISGVNSQTSHQLKSTQLKVKHEVTKQATESFALAPVKEDAIFGGKIKGMSQTDIFAKAEHLERLTIAKGRLGADLYQQATTNDGAPAPIILNANQRTELRRAESELLKPNTTISRTQFEGRTIA